MVLLLGAILCWLAIGSLIGVSLRAEATFPEEVDWSLIATVAIVWLGQCGFGIRAVTRFLKQLESDSWQ
jgi:hypothetical protein